MKIFDEFAQYSPEWWSYRAGKPSGSKAKLLVTSKGAASESLVPYAKELASVSVFGRDEDQYESYAMKRGTELEPEARSDYELIYDVDVIEVGLVTDDLERYLVSPDGLISGNGSIEIKCPEWKEMTNFMIYYSKYKKLSSGYVAQTQMQIKTMEREWCDSIFYHPRYPLVVVRTYLDNKIDVMLDIQLAKVIFERDKYIEILKGF